ncbi:MAG: LemA family protein [Candidatus Riflebacteria bacterium]|nr:LemA family protein [Candidatus Riflebacteria bacterium]
MIPNINRLTRKYSDYEEKIFKYISASRESFGRTTFEEALKNSGESCSEMIALAEQYPNLKSVQSVQALINEIITTENRIVDAKIKFNEVSDDFNQMIELFPGNLFASILGFSEVEYSGIEEH